LGAGTRGACPQALAVEVVRYEVTLFGRSEMSEIWYVNEDPKARALNMVENGIVPADGMLINAFKYMSNDDVQNMLEFYYSEGKHENRRSA